MDEGRIDPVTGHPTTGHEWNGIEELNTPVPWIVLICLAGMVLFSIVYWILMPAWPTGTSYTKGMLGVDQRQIVTRQLERAATSNARWKERLLAKPIDEIANDASLVQDIHRSGQVLFEDNCAVCHGMEGAGGPGFPDLSDQSWLWGGELETIEETIRVGINATHNETRISEMMAFGRDGILTREEILSVSAYIRSLAGQSLDDKTASMLDGGREIFDMHCASCHGARGHGDHAVGSPNLVDTAWIYGGDAQSIYTTVSVGRQGTMPHWSDRLSPTDIRILAIYVSKLGAEN